ncbi:unnamed protein product [Lasius platythorax]|uniref:Uncharacterized protein n=1 Tax=Lasius platythorax TaxID=488582 RepID=A0AAV2NB19_9HYME
MSLSTADRDAERESTACAEEQKYTWEADEHAGHTWLFAKFTSSPASSLPRSSNPPRRAASTAQIYDARNSPMAR